MTPATDATPPEPARATHRAIVRATHWLNAVTTVCMIGSGWRIYNAAPFFPFVFPSSLTLGDWLGGALAIHFAAMWVLAINFATYLAWSLASGHIGRAFLPVSLAGLRADIVQALTYSLKHAPGP